MQKIANISLQRQNMKIKNKIISLFLSVLFISSTFAIDKTQIPLKTNSQPKGKIIMVILDVSGSIRKQYPYIANVITKSLVQDRLEVGDYFVLIPFGDNALPLYSGQLLREEDKTSICNNITTLNPDQDYTDIGQALKEGLSQIVSLKQQDFDLYEPLVLFITDGDITTGVNSPYFQQPVETIFEDPLIGDKQLYDGWYYVGIGKDLHDLTKIAQLSGREDCLLSIEDLSQLEFILDDWISKIPSSRPLEQGEIKLSNFKLGNYKLNPKKSSTVSNAENELNYDLVSTFQQTESNVELLSATGSFQSDDKSSLVPIKLSTEAGKIKVTPLSKKHTEAAFNPSKTLTGKGIVKVTFNVKVNGVENEVDEVFPVNMKTPSQILFSKVFIPLICLLAIIILIVAIIIIKKIMPVKVSMEIVGKLTKLKPVSMGINKKVDFGSKPGAPFKLDSELFGSVIGQLQRVGPNKWEIIPRDLSAFESNTKIDYKLNTPIKIKTKDDSSLTIKFKVKK